MENSTTTQSVSEEYYVVIKNKKYLVGYSYYTGIGYRYKWSHNIEDAIKYDPLHSDADYYAGVTKGNLKHIIK
jgi:hypothetical protein